MVIPVGGVEFHLGELGVVGGVYTFVAEVTTNFVNTFQVAHEQALEVKLKGDAQVEVLFELVVVGDERFRGRAAIQRLHNRRFHFQETIVIQESAHEGDNAGTGAENLTHLRR